MLHLCGISSVFMARSFPGRLKRILLEEQWWGKLDERNISYKNSRKDSFIHVSLKITDKPLLNKK